MGKINSNDKVIYKGHLTLVTRPHEERDYDVIVSKDAAVMLYIDEKDQTYLTKQFRPAMEKEMIALPAETLDKPQLSSLETIVEGLEEECGIRIRPEQAKSIGKVTSSDGHDTEEVHLYLAHGPGKYVGQRLEDSEKIEVLKVPFEKAYQMVLSNEIQSSKSKYLIMYEKLRRIGEIK